MANLKKIELAGTVYNVRGELDFTNVVCDLEDRGVDIMSVMNGTTTQTFSACRAIVSVFLNKDLIEAGKMITRHISKGGTLEPVIELFRDLMIEAGFGQEDEEEKTEE